MAGMHMSRRRWGLGGAGVATLVAALAVGLAGTGAAAPTTITFHMARSQGSIAAGCLANAGATVTVTSSGPVETMKIHATGLPANTGFDLFVIQIPNKPFGMSWYQGDMESNGSGVADGTFVGRFSIETFIVAPGVANAPVTEPTDANKNPQTAPVQMYHLGLWFDSVAAGAAAGCEPANAATTPFNGDHTAGAQALSTRNFPFLSGPLRQLS